MKKALAEASAFFNEVCLAAHEAHLRCVKYAFGTICGTLHFTAPKEQLHYAAGITSLGSSPNFTFDKPCPFCVDMVKCVHANEEATNTFGGENMNFQFKYADKTRMEEILPVCFEILYANMSVIAPTGDSYEEDRRLWCDNVYPLMGKAERQLALLYCEEELAGYFQYSVLGNTLLMEEIQFRAAYHGTGMFRQLYAWLTEQLPKDLCYVAAYVHKNNQKSQNILRYLGLVCCGENKNGNSFYYKGSYQVLLDKYGKQQ